MKRTRILKWRFLITLILSLLVASGCATTSPRLIAPPNFVQKNLARLIAAETKQEKLMSEVQIARQFNVDIETIKKEFLSYRDLHWVYFIAAQTHLVNGDLDLFVQSIAKAELYTQKAQNILDKQIKSMASPSGPEAKNQSLSF